MTFQQCSGAVRTARPVVAGQGWRARGASWGARSKLGSMAASAMLAACSGAGGGADDNPFAASGTGGGAPLASAGSGGGRPSPAQGGTTNSAPGDNMLDTPGLVDPDPDEPAPM